MCGPTVTSSGSRAEGMGDGLHLHCVKVEVETVQAALSSWMVVVPCLTVD